MKRGTKTDPLTTEDYTFLLVHADDMTPSEIAKARGKQYFTVLKALSRARSGAIRSVLHPVPCVVCGEVVQGPRGREVHPGCHQEKVRRKSARRRRENPDQKSTAYVRKWRRENPEANSLLRDREKALRREQIAALPVEERLAMAEKVHAADVRDQEITAPRAVRGGEEWTAEEDRIILERRKDPARDVALTLGRTLWAVRHRRSRLLKREQSP